MSVCGSLDSISGLMCGTEILQFMVQNGQCEFIMEVTDKTRADVKVCRYPPM